ncbi:hypothetical protein Ddye_005308 [Dipteronia dyeriana]|uniref:Uncharacterized protein n=1 Tax=Dipteronia dyeriana TaxID=168575 RepID=A0AAD9XG82_9ROSI|nr:hypothetical protein Ddye_005308 [Dipteronia dyeriana]
MQMKGNLQLWISKFFPLYRWSLNSSPSGKMIGLECAGSRESLCIRNLEEVAEVSPFIVFLSKTKLNGMNLDKLKCSLGFIGCFCVNSGGSSGGLLLLWKDNLVATVLSFFAGHIDGQVCMEDGFL